MAVAQFIVVVCFVVIFVVFTVDLCAAVGGLAWSCLKDAITDWKQYQLKDRVITIQEYKELMDSLETLHGTVQETDKSIRTLYNVLRAKGLLDSCEATTC